VKAATTAADVRLAKLLILDELFDLSLYKALREVAPPQLTPTLDSLIPTETRHFAFWQEFFGMRVTRLDAGRRLKLGVLVMLCRIFGAPAIHLVLEAIEIHGVRKYLQVWTRYGDTPLGAALRDVLEDEFKHEDATVGGDGERRVSPERVRNIFLGSNDGLVEILGAVSGFFAAFGNPGTVLVAGLTVAVAGALSMAAGAYAAVSSEEEVRGTEIARRKFLGEANDDDAAPRESALGSGLIVGASYFAGALVPVLPVLFGARSALVSVFAAGTMIILVSAVLAFLSGMDVRRRILINLVIIAAAVGVTYAIGMLTRTLFGIQL
jgi:vacuolar iron transporter family protein